MTALVALLADVVAIVMFAVLGRRSHVEANTLVGVLGTAWPFLVGALVGHLLYRLLRSLRPEPLSWRTGAVVWVCTLLIGMLLRVASGGTVALSFAVVAGVVLGAFLFGWRGLVRLSRRARMRATGRGWHENQSVD